MRQMKPNRKTESEGDVQSRMHQAMQEGVLTALSKLARAVQCQYTFGTHSELRACVALSRLAPFFLVEIEPEESIWEKVHPAHTRSEAIALMRSMNYPEEIITGGGYIPARDDRPE